MRASDLIVILLLVAGAAISIISKKLTPAAAGTGALLGIAVYAGGGYPGLLLLALFFLLGTSATSWKKIEKGTIRGNAAHESTRRPGQVIANAGVAATAGIMALLLPADKALFLLLMAASLSSATADTLSSELGMVYGRRFYHLLTLKPDERGLDGVVSIEGVLIGIAGSALIAIAYALTTGWDIRSVSIIVLAGTAGNLLDSLLGALFERKGLLSNDAVNFLNTLGAAAIAAALALTPYPRLAGHRKVAGQSHSTHTPAQNRTGQYRTVTRTSTGFSGWASCWESPEMQDRQGF